MKISIYFVLIFLLFTVSTICIGQESGLASNDTSNITYDFEPLTEVSESLDIQGIWKITLVDDKEVIAGIKQSGETLYGFCKSEGENPWNGIIAGLIRERNVVMAIAALEKDSIVSTQLSGSVVDSTMQGNYTQYDGKNNATTSKFTAKLINTKAGEYIPATVEKFDEIKMEPQQTSNQAIIAENSRFRDVKNFATGINPNIMPNHAPL